MNEKTRLYLVRHGEVVNHDQGVYNGHNDVAITPRGMAQMEAVANRLAEESLGAVYCSDLVRSRESARIVARAHDLEPQPIRDLRELDFGLWSGLSFQEIERRFPGGLEKRGEDLYGYRIPGGESVADLMRRVIPRIEEILRKMAGRSAALVLHGGVNRVILARALHCDPDHLYSIHQDYGCINIIDFYKKLAVTKLMNGLPCVDW